MKRPFKDILKHSGVYGLGQILARLASVFLLPLYTRYLQPADYGTIALLDLTTGILGLLISGGVVGGVTRYHFEKDDHAWHREVWWTGLVVVLLSAAAITVPALLMREALAAVMIGAVPAGGYYLLLALPTIALTTLAQLADQYLRVRKWSWLVVVISLGGLLLNIGLNVYFLTAAGMGVAGVLLGNLITAVVTAAVPIGILIWRCGAPRLNLPLGARLLRFGVPLVGTSLLAIVMHSSDRYVLRMFVDLESVGIYSLGYTIGQGVNTLFLAPFTAIWAVAMYEIAREADAKRNFGRVFEFFIYALMLIMLGVSLFIRPLLEALVPPAYWGAAYVVPVVCLGLVLFSAHEHFKVPALLAKKTERLLPAYFVAAVVNVALNLAIVPRFGIIGAAWVTVATYGLFSALGLRWNRAIDRIEYPLRRCAAVLLAMVVTYLACAYLQSVARSTLWAVTLGAVAWLGWAAALGCALLRRNDRLPLLVTSRLAALRF